jgi:LuxR family transcriptional regulator, quorum-sensing system regulator BjaR1
MDESTEPQTTDPRAAQSFSAKEVMECAAALQQAASPAELTSTLASWIKRHGFLGFSFSAIRRVKTLYLQARMLSSWPPAIHEVFDQDALFNVDPVIIRSRREAGPFVWTLGAYDAANPQQQKLLALRRSAGVTGGICIPIAEAFRGRSVLYLSGAGFDQSATAILALQLVAQQLCARFNELYEQRADDANAGVFFHSSGELSPRERKVFGWIAFGKSSREIATIMAISEHTVNDYISSAVSKLNASNRTDAMMRALLTNQIDLG